MSADATRIISSIRPIIPVLVFLCLPIPLASAVSIYDIIELSRKGYSDEAIVDVMEATESVFELTAEDFPRLRNLGVSELVIRKMRETMPAEQRETTVSLPGQTTNRPRSSRANDPSNRKYVSGVFAEPLTEVNSVLPAAVRAQFFLAPVHEEGAGGHTHLAVEFGGVPLFILRDEGQYASINDRGIAVARHLEDARRLGDGEFRPVHVNGVDSVVFSHDSNTRLPIVFVSNRDAYAYDVRSERRVSPEILAAYWSALLNDYWAIAVKRHPPDELVSLHNGDALALLFEVIANDGVQNLDLAVERLPYSIREHLEDLAFAVPGDFEGRSNRLIAPATAF